MTAEERRAAGGAAGGEMDTSAGEEETEGGTAGETEIETGPLSGGRRFAWLNREFCVCVCFCFLN